MGIRIGAIFLMITLVAGFTSFPSSLSNYSTEIVDQPNSLNLINTAFADSDNGKGNDKEKGKPDDVGKDKEKKLAEKQAKNNEDYEDNEIHYDEEHEFEGIITAIDENVSFDLLLEDCTTVTIFTNDTSGLMLDFEVEVEVVLSNGSHVATEIEVEDEEDDEEHEFEGIITKIVKDVSFDLLLEDCTTVTIFTNDTSGLMLDFEVEVEVVLSNSSLVATEIEVEDEDDEDHIQEFNGATVVHMSSTTTICHKPGTPAEKTKELPERALKGHLGHGDVLGPCSDITLQTLENILSKKEIKQLKKLTRLAENPAEKGSMALDRAYKLIEKLEQRITQLEQRLQTLLDKVESGEYYGTLTQLDTVKQLHSISFDGTATSIYEESDTSGLSGEIFIENLMTGSNTSKFKVTGGEIIVGDYIYDAAFGKVRVSSLGIPGEKDSMVVIIQTFDSEDNDNTIKLTLLFDSAITADLGTEPINFEIKPNSKISEQWFLSGSGTISLK
ncbi:MAG: hypothetical protein IH792_04840 [Thaumarchaeota archaeon]|nr:hypothetical protein [Nitrososphaerota archaeon]